MSKARSRTASGVHSGAGGKDAGPSAVANPKRDIRDTVLIGLVLAAITVIAFWGVLGNQFVNYDDTTYILSNPNVLTGLTPANIAWAFNVGYCGNWHPLTWISHMLDITLFGLNPAGHHAVNLVLHVASTILLFLMLNRTTRSRWKSAFVAALFAVHPLHVESVAWAAERKDVLSALFWMLTMLAYVHYTERPSVKRYVLVVSAFVLGLMAKPMMVTLPVVLLLLDYWPLGRMSDGKHSIRNLIQEKLPLLALSIGASILTFIAQRRGEMVSSLELIPLGLRIENAVVSYAAYMGKMLYPRGLALLYPHPMHSLPAWQIGGAAILLAGITTFAVLNRTKRPYVLAGWLWYIVTLIPVIGLVQVGGQAMADRYTYIPLIGLFMAIAWGAPESVGDRARVLPVVSGIIIVVLSGLTCIQVGYWKNNMTLFSHTIECTKGNYIILDALGLALADEGKLDEAIAQYEKALQIAPFHVASRLDLGIALCGLGRVDEAIEQFHIAAQYDPKFADSNSYDAYRCLGAVLTAHGRYTEAIKQYNVALKIAPNRAPAHCSLGVALAYQGKTDEAIREYRESLLLDPGYDQAHYNLGKALATQKKWGEAAAEYMEMIRLMPDNAEAHNSLGNVYLNQGEIDSAVREYREALRLKPGFAEARVSLDAALQGRGKDAGSFADSNQHYNAGVELQNQNKTDEAILEYRQAIEARPDFAQAHNNLALAYFEKGSFAEAWKEVHLCRKYDLEPHPAFVQALEEKMPDPQP